MAINTITLDLASKSLDALWERSNVISNNIANVDTAGFKQQSVSFEDTLSSAINGGNLTQSEVNGLSPQVVTEQGTVGTNGNGVDMDAQMVELARNSLQYNYMTRATSGSLTMLRSAAAEGRS